MSPESATETAARNGSTQAAAVPPLFLSPSRLLVAGCVAYAVTWILAPVDAVHRLSDRAWLFLAGTILAFVLGDHLAKRGRTGAVPMRMGVDDRRDAVLFRATAAAAALGIAARLVDRFQLRGAVVGEGVFALRGALEGTDFSAVSVFGAVLFPFCQVPLFLQLGSRVRGTRRSTLIAVVLFSYPALDALFVGGRSLIVVSASLFGLMLLYWRRVQLTLRTLFVGTVAAAGLAIGALAVFEARLDQMSMDFLDSVFQSAYAHTIVPEPWVVDVVSAPTSPPAAQVVARATLHASQYVTHGVLEYGLQIDEYTPTTPHTWGRQTFFPYFKFVQFITGSHADDPTSGFVSRIGVFKSFWGPWWIDFGWFGIPLMGLFGLLMRLMFDEARAGRYAIGPAYLMLATVLVFAPVVNLLQSALGTYFLTSFLAYYLVDEAARRKRRAT